MAAIASASSSGLILDKSGKSSARNGVSMFQYNGLRAVETMHVGSTGIRRTGFISTSESRLKTVLEFSLVCNKIELARVLSKLRVELELEQFDVITPVSLIALSKVRKNKSNGFSNSFGSQERTDPKKRIVITGMGLVSVFGSDVDTFYNKLLDGVSGITPIDRFDASEYSVKFAGQIRDFSSKGYIDGKNDRRLDDAWRYCLVAGKRALDDASLGKDVLDKMDKTRIGVLVGSDTGLMGPNYSISTACATANYCFFAAANHIRRGDADIMVAGGTESPITPAGVGGFIACRALSSRNDKPHEASRPWDKNRDGFVIGEGAGLLIMESLEHAVKRGANIIAEYLGGAVTCDAHHMTDPRKDGLGVSSCIIKSLQDAGVAPEEVNYVNAHATSTLAGDLAEVNAIKKVFKDTSEIKMNGTKSMIGHGLGAAGGVEAIATIKAITTGCLHPTINQYDLEPEVTIDTVQNVKKA
ncbi:3-oxoacyl-[acyl-carrier-protein] synthase I, chloroplastic [Sesamum angolense]|uniref:beta-ketoacyl-[acyl-carrier-protein] synthase I n=1 Tax=Sesamum angolense TaxID=2727404 RepID=A0AAE1T5X9_9LAMI|nr:3-oxoacyl-[acyl-carrier-protein] synthase I, chloroplastic [Sesamum angolense]